MNITPNELISDEIILPNHKNELDVANTAIETLKTELKYKQKQKKICDVDFIRMYEETVKMLDYLGNISTPLFEICDKLEYKYISEYIATPKLAKKLWLDHCHKIHHPYDTLKNRCFRLLDELDELYIKCNKKHPPNWNI